MAPTWHTDLRKHAYAKYEELKKHQVLLEDVRGDAGTCDLCQTGRSEHQGALCECWACRHTYHHTCIDVLRVRAANRGEPLAYGCPHCGRPWATLAMLEQQAEEAARRPGPGGSPRRGLPFTDGMYTFNFRAATRQYLCKWKDRVTGGICGQGPFDTFEDFYRHHSSAHVEILDYLCDLCEPGRGFVSAKLLVQHKKVVHFGDPRRGDKTEPEPSSAVAEGEAADGSVASLAEQVELMDLDVVDSIEDEAMQVDK
ncbi:uncharacterized protein BO95DRAFT_461865 [Aspergillus brunneoviolaceus CBS 621.78]|uniref:Uncharacterized protein n=1 Tax=Aspergillus brunneoviolaceus CBS 621.78 TaxID=1450534 RepID=A0ACD1GES7_9EURO|nr:hypothetical protein BO95DRAFT_461865 [Aspergillus brunneoviolaceus CBS 621.78]RAH47799.1 hypothetical protein BO95DRAFT_461865 [Aspergillus brunneoviolaceus CBS 621.78]